MNVSTSTKLSSIVAAQTIDFCFDSFNDNPFPVPPTSPEQNNPRQNFLNHSLAFLFKRLFAHQQKERGDSTKGRVRERCPRLTS